MAFVCDDINFLDSLDDEFQEMESMNVGILKCKGLPQKKWNTKCMTLYNTKGRLVDEGTFHSINFDHTLGANGLFRDTHLLMHISKTLSKAYIL